MGNTNMKAQHGTTGSFGIPPQFQEATERARTKQAQPQPQQQPQREPEPVVAEPTASAPAPEDPKAKETNPIKNLEKLGAQFTDEDFQKLLFKGYYETELDIVKGKMRATFRTLLGSEYDDIDETMATDVKEINMTNEGFETRRAVLIVAYGVTHLNGKPIVKPVMTKDNKVDTKATALERRKVIGALAPAVTNLLIQKHGAITVSINAIVASPDDFVKNS